MRMKRLLSGFVPLVSLLASAPSIASASRHSAISNWKTYTGPHKVDPVILLIALSVIFLPTIIMVLVAVVRHKKEKALEEELYQRHEQHLSSLSEKEREKEIHGEFVARERALMTDSLRYDILRRDHFRCQICGATANDGYRLHVDHIKPVSKGGKTEPSNLRTLCERCNMGKGAKLE